MGGRPPELTWQDSWDVTDTAHTHPPPDTEHFLCARPCAGNQGAEEDQVQTPLGER